MDLLVPRWSLKMIWFGYGTLLCHQVGWPPYIDMTLILGTTKRAAPLEMLPTWHRKTATTQTSSKGHPENSIFMISDIDITSIRVAELSSEFHPCSVTTTLSGICPVYLSPVPIDMTREKRALKASRRFQKIPRTITSLPLPRPSWKSMMNMADLCLISVRKEPWASEWRANF